MSHLVSGPKEILTIIQPKIHQSFSAIQDIVEYVEFLVKTGGPEPLEYSTLNEVFDIIAENVHLGYWPQEQLTAIRQAFGEAISVQTLQGKAFHKTHGYAGDYEIIDKIYQHYVSPNPTVSNWDRFFHQHSAPKAVRNRLSYFINLIWNLQDQYEEEIHVLNLASGPGRDMYEAFRFFGCSKIHLDCVEQDAQAIQYATSLCQDYLSSINFTHCNVFRFRPKQTYQLIWASGLFDYFSDAVFKRLVKRLLPYLANGGKLVIGNFSENNPSRSYMEVVDWILHLRSEEKLISLAEECGVPRENISVEQETEGVNLFLHITKPKLAGPRFLTNSFIFARQ